MQNYALIRERAGHATVQKTSIPKLRDDYILVKTVCVALNPTDHTTLDAVGDPGTIVGCDYSGIVEEVGKAVTRPFKKGDRVAGFAHGGKIDENETNHNALADAIGLLVGNDSEPENGAFARFIAVKGDTQVHIPDNVSFEAAAAAGVGIGTVGFGLYKILGLPLPDADVNGDGTPILIYGGSTASGTLAIQFAKLSGRYVITTCSPKHFDLMKALGADLVYDYRAPNVGEEIREATAGRLKDVFDTVAINSSAAICAAALGPAGGRYCNLLGVDCPRTDVESIFFLGYTQSGESFIFEGEGYEAQPEHFKFAVKFAEIAENLWAKSLFKPHPQRVEPGGLIGINNGLQEMREGRVSGEKLVYRVEETTWD